MTRVTTFRLLTAVSAALLLARASLLGELAAEPTPPVLPRLYAITDLGTLGGVNSYAYGINANGAIAGASEIGGVNTRAFLWTDAGGLRNLGTLGGLNSFGSGVNDLGHVIGSSEIGAATHAFVWDGAVLKDLGVRPGESNSYGSAISTVDGHDFGTGSLQRLNPPPYDHAFELFGTALFDIGTLGGHISYGNAVNRRGWIARESSLLGDTVYHAFAFNGAIMRDLGTLGGIYSYALGINTAHQVTGVSRISSLTSTVRQVFSARAADKSFVFNAWFENFQNSD
jgi:probable HAF family extracellular repeat protein